MHEKDLLGCLLNSKDENGEVLSDDKIADNIIGVLFAAQDTTASVMTWIVKYLHDNPKLLEGVKVLPCLSIRSQIIREVSLEQVSLAFCSCLLSLNFI